MPGLFSLAEPFHPRHFRAVQASRHLHLRSLHFFVLHDFLKRLLEDAPERNALFQLIGGLLGDQLGVAVRARHFFDLQTDLRFRFFVLSRLVVFLRHLILQRFDAAAAFADDEPGTRSEDNDGHAICRTLYFHLLKPELDQFLRQERTDHVIFLEKTGVVARVKPARFPSLGDSQPKYKWIYFSSHGDYLSVLMLNALRARPVRRFAPPLGLRAGASFPDDRMGFAPPAGGFV